MFAHPLDSLVHTDGWTSGETELLVGGHDYPTGELKLLFHVLSGIAEEQLYVVLEHIVSPCIFIITLL